MQVLLDNGKKTNKPLCVRSNQKKKNSCMHGVAKWNFLCDVPSFYTIPKFSCTCWEKKQATCANGVPENALLVVHLKLKINIADRLIK